MMILIGILNTDIKIALFNNKNKKYVYKKDLIQVFLIQMILIFNLKT